MSRLKNISDKAIILSRTDFGERDRIITFLTSKHGKLKAIAKAVRASKSKLAGGIELFAENELVLIVGRGDLCTLRSSRMSQFYGNITSDIDRSLFAYDCLKFINKFTVDEEGSEYYPYLIEVLRALNEKDNSLEQIKIWFYLKLLELRGVSPNLKTLSNQQPIPPGKKYNFDFDHQCFLLHEAGKYTQNHIKILRYFNYKKSFGPIDKCPESLLKETRLLGGTLVSDFTS
jgi:DNA repair protein RecO